MQNYLATQKVYVYILGTGRAELTHKYEVHIIEERERERERSFFFWRCCLSHVSKARIDTQVYV